MTDTQYTFPAALEHPSQSIQRDQVRCLDCMDTGYQAFGLNASIPCRNPRHMYDPCRDCGSRHHSTCA